MALTRKMLKALGIDDDKADEIIDAHAETVSSLKQQVEDAKAHSSQAEALQKEVDELKQQLEDGSEDAYKAKYETETVAHFYETTMANPEALETLKAYFPETYNVFEKILRGA